MGLILFLIFLHFHLLLALPQPDVAPIRPFRPTQTPPATIQAFPEQSDLATGCPLDLPDELFHRISNACGGKARSGQLRRSQCCPVLAAWIYAAYSNTALGSSSRMPSIGAGAGAGAGTGVPSSSSSSSSPYDLPVLPDDSETCVENLEKSLKLKGVELRKPNETCDVVYCYCGIRLHPLSCPEAFSVGKEGKLVGDENVKKLERDCLHHNNKSYSSLSGCSKCLKTLYKLKGTTNKNTTSSSSSASASADRKTKMHNRDCELMGLTWLLSKNRTAYMPTVSAVLRAIMMNADDSNPQSCSLASDGMPLAVDSDEIDDQSSSNRVESPIHLIFLMAICLMVYVCGMVVLK